MNPIVDVRSLEDSAKHAAHTFSTFTDGRPILVPTGITAVDLATGGLGPGSTMIIGADNGLGKSSVVLDACLTNQAAGVKCGYISHEDTPDVVGCRLLARYSGVDSRRIRTKEFRDGDLAKLERGMRLLRQDAELPHSIEFAYTVGGSLLSVLAAMDELKQRGCGVVYHDYVQKFRDTSLGADRRHQIGGAFTLLQGRAFELELAFVEVSQISRQIVPGKRPSRHALKETGDLENEARIILMLWRDEVDNLDILDGYLDKSTFGGEGRRMQWRRAACGSLFQFDESKREEEF